jgi:hypothetical protein
MSNVESALVSLLGPLLGLFKLPICLVMSATDVL